MFTLGCTRAGLTAARLNSAEQRRQGATGAVKTRSLGIVQQEHGLRSSNDGVQGADSEEEPGRSLTASPLVARSKSKKRELGPCPQI
jgi:hypothetical protein